MRGKAREIVAGSKRRRTLIKHNLVAGKREKQVAIVKGKERGITCKRRPEIRGPQVRSIERAERMLLVENKRTVLPRTRDLQMVFGQKRRKNLGKDS